jgi:hypothetical protein
MSFHRYLDEQLRLRPRSTCISPIHCLHHHTNTYHTEILEWSRLLNVLQCLLQILQLQINTSLRLLGILDSLCLKSLNGLELSSNIVSRGLESAEVLLDLIDDGLVLQDLAVAREVDGLWLFGELLDSATGIFVALLESLEGGCGLATETEGLGHFGPVKLECCASLEEMNC